MYRSSVHLSPRLRVGNQYLSLRVAQLHSHSLISSPRHRNPRTRVSITSDLNTLPNPLFFSRPFLRVFSSCQHVASPTRTPSKTGQHQGTPNRPTTLGAAGAHHEDGPEGQPQGGSGTAGPFPFGYSNPFTTGSSVFDAAISTVIGLSMVFFGGVAYIYWYKRNVLVKIEKAFEPGYDPALELASHGKARNLTYPSAEDAESDTDGPWTKHLRRKEQDRLDRIIHGLEHGHYYMLLGPKGTGKTTMIFDAMMACQADGVAICDAHPDLEVFRLRLGKALNYEYNEDTQTGLFQRRDPREGGPALDIERAMHKLGKVALNHARRTGKPLVLIINNCQFFKNDDEGRNILLQLQQHAEAWSASGIVTFVFSSDDFWPFFVMRKSASRMHVLSIYDLNHKEALHANRRMRISSLGSSQVEDPSEDFSSSSSSSAASSSSSHSPSPPTPVDEDATMKEVISIVGGRLSYLGKVAKAKDMKEHAEHMLAVEKAWLRSQIGLIEDCDDDVMDEQKWSSCSWLLLREFVKKRQEDEKEMMDLIEAGEKTQDDLDTLPLPKIPYYQCRQIMTRPDFLEELDRLNIIAIDINHDVTPDSLLLLRAAREVVEEDGFDDSLDSVRDRVDEIESLHRTRELTFKDVVTGDRIRLTVDKGGARLFEEKS